ncbi:uncharacterized protein [Euphorbia lathyris]|uniref:uncharacterized protein n=1 Tax=Euphorbia lathyris TaxID=212925 RepID=UPI00331403B4
MEDSKPVHDIPLQNPNLNPNPPPKPSPTLSQQSPPLPASMPLPHTSAPVSMPPPPATAPVSMPPPPPPPPAPAGVSLPPRSKKRPLESNAQIQDCSYFKIRAVLKDMRPHLLEVIRAVDFRNCKGADELRDRMKLLMQLYQQMTAEGVTVTKCSSGNGAAQKPEQLPADNKEAIDLEEKSCYIGGSAFGWNFITFASTKAVYYGRTKESYRASRAAL